MQPSPHLQHPHPPTSSTSLPVSCGDAAAAAVAAIPATPAPERPAVARPPVEWVEGLFERLAAILGSQWIEGMCAGVDPAVVKAEWAKGLTGMSREEIARGLAGTRLRKFPPNLPEFLHLCRPSLDPELAWCEAVEGMREWRQGKAYAWTHPAVFWAAMGMREELRTRSFAEQRGPWSRRMSQQWAQLGGWEPIPEPPRPIADARGPADPRVVAEAKARMLRTREQAILRGSPAGHASGFPATGPLL